MLSKIEQITTKLKLITEKQMLLIVIAKEVFFKYLFPIKTLF